MKKLFLIIIIFLLIQKPIYATNAKLPDFLNNIPLAQEYKENESFNISRIPERMFYKLNTDCKYYILNNKDVLYIVDDKLGGLMLVYNTFPMDLGIDEEIATDELHTTLSSSLYLIRSNNEYYIFVDKVFCYDYKGYRLYHLSNDKIELIEDESGRIDFVGYDYIIGYTALGMIGYQQCEFKMVLKNGKLELDGEYKVVENDGNYPFWHYYTLVKDLKYEEYDDKAKKYKEKVLKTGTKIRALSTDAKTYITIEVEDGRNGKVKVDKVRNRDFIVNGQVFMNYYFIDGTQSHHTVYNPGYSY